MKYGKYIILALVLAGGLFSCQRDEDIAIAVLNINSEVIEPSYTSANVECYVECNTKLDNVSIEYALTEDFADAQSVAMTEKEGKYRAKCENLLDDTTYYVRYIVSNRLSSMTYKEISSFRTLKPSIPVVHMDSISNIWDVKAEAFAHIEFDGGAPISDWGITIWTDEKNDTLFIKSESQERCLIQIQGLQPNTIYHARAYAINKVGAAYSKQEITFTTFALPEVQTYEITDIQLTTAFLSGKLLFNGNDTATVKGFCWSENTEPTIEDALIQIDTITNEFSYHLSNLKDETKYHVRAYAKNKIGVVYGDIVSFTTKAAILPTVVTTPTKEIDYHNAIVGGIVTNDGGTEVTERGVVYSTSQNPTTSNTKITSGTGRGLFTCDITNLQEGTIYYVRAYAINKKGTSYGEQKSFTTKAYAVPTVTTSSATNISYTSATVGGNVTNDGGATVTERGFVYSTSQNPTTSNTKVTCGTGTGSFSYSLSNLQDGTTYYVRAYAINKKGTSYGEQKSFITIRYALPTVTTSAVTNITHTSAIVSGNIDFDGGSAILERGIVYSTTPTPTINHNKEECGSGLGTFACTLNGLQYGKTYYVRAYAKNQKGVSYGNVLSFSAIEYKNITVKALVPSHWKGTITAWVWESEDSGRTIYPTKEGEWYVVTEYCSRLNILFRNGTEWSEYSNQSVDINSITEDICVRFSQSGTNKATYTIIDCETKRLEHTYTDLGLTVKWATCNVGANMPEENGHYFAWGETLTKNSYVWNLYKWCNASPYSLTKYNINSSYGSVDNKTLLDQSDDVATIRFGTNWRMPTSAEFIELKNNCTWTWTVQNGVNGYKVTSKSNGNSIFLPAAGYKDGTSLLNSGISGYYWSSSLDTSTPYDALYIYLNANDISVYDYYRYLGLSVRPVFQ